MAQISPSDLASVGVGDAAQIDPGNGTGPFRGTVDNISPSVDPDTRAVVARIVAPNPGDLLKKQMYVDVSNRIRASQPPGCWCRSRRCCATMRTCRSSMSPADGSFARRHVTLGYRDDQITT